MRILDCTVFLAHLEGINWGQLCINDIIVSVKFEILLMYSHPLMNNIMGVVDILITCPSLFINYICIGVSLSSSSVCAQK